MSCETLASLTGCLLTLDEALNKVLAHVTTVPLATLNEFRKQMTLCMGLAAKLEGENKNLGFHYTLTSKNLDAALKKLVSLENKQKKLLSLINEQKTKPTLPLRTVKNDSNSAENANISPYLDAIMKLKQIAAHNAESALLWKEKTLKQAEYVKKARKEIVDIAWIIKKNETLITKLEEENAQLRLENTQLTQKTGRNKSNDNNTNTSSPSEISMMKGSKNDNSDSVNKAPNSAENNNITLATDSTCGSTNVDAANKYNGKSKLDQVYCFQPLKTYQRETHTVNALAIDHQSNNNSNEYSDCRENVIIPKRCESVKIIKGKRVEASDDNSQGFTDDIFIQTGVTNNNNKNCKDAYQNEIYITGKETAKAADEVNNSDNGAVITKNPSSNDDAILAKNKPNIGGISSLITTTVPLVIKKNKSSNKSLLKNCVFENMPLPNKVSITAADNDDSNNKSNNSNTFWTGSSSESPSHLLPCQTSCLQRPEWLNEDTETIASKYPRPTFKDIDRILDDLDLKLTRSSDDISELSNRFNSNTTESANNCQQKKSYYNSSNVMEKRFNVNMKSEDKNESECTQNSVPTIEKDMDSYDLYSAVKANSNITVGCKPAVSSGSKKKRLMQNLQASYKIGPSQFSRVENSDSNNSNKITADTSKNDNNKDKVMDVDVGKCADEIAGTFSLISSNKNNCNTNEIRRLNKIREMESSQALINLLQMNNLNFDTVADTESFSEGNDGFPPDFFSIKSAPATVNRSKNENNITNNNMSKKVLQPLINDCQPANSSKKSHSVDMDALNRSLAKYNENTLRNYMFPTRVRKTFSSEFLSKVNSSNSIDEITANNDGPSSAIAESFAVDINKN